MTDETYIQRTQRELREDAAREQFDRVADQRSADPGRPTDAAIVQCVASAWAVTPEVALSWILNVTPY
jgi:hypothetical protein